MKAIYWTLNLTLIASSAVTFIVGTLTHAPNLLHASALLMLSLLLTTLCLTPRTLHQPATITSLHENMQCSSTPPLPTPTNSTHRGSNYSVPPIPAPTEPSLRNY